MPLLRTVLIVLSVFYIIKNKVIYDQQTKEDQLGGPKTTESQSQKDYRESQQYNGLMLSGVLFVVLMVLRHINIKAEKKELKELQEKYKSRKLETIEEEEDDGIPFRPVDLVEDSSTENKLKKD